MCYIEQKILHQMSPQRNLKNKSASFNLAHPLHSDRTDSRKPAEMVWSISFRVSIKGFYAYFSHNATIMIDRRM